MSTPSRLRVHGPDHLAAGRVTLYPALDREGAPAALVISSGLRKTTNEDAGGWDRFNRRAFYAVADAHFGPRSAELAVDIALSSLAARLLRKDHFEPDRFRRVLAEALARVEERLAAEPAGESETTLLVLASGHGRFFWGSFGDSRLYTAGGAYRRQVNRTDGNFLGAAKRTARELADLLVCGELRGIPARRGVVRLMLATDGFPQSRGATLPEWNAEAICDLLAEAADVSSAAADLTAEALRRGGADNLCAVLIEIPQSR